MNIALVGNQNCGKTTLFNALTGSNQKVGNWAGVTIEKKIGIIKGTSHSLIDLPGIYSLTPYTAEEAISCNYIINEKPDLIINLIDSTCLERSLYLTTQLIQLNCKIILALNMTELLENKGQAINEKTLSKLLSLPVLKPFQKFGRTSFYNFYSKNGYKISNHEASPNEINADDSAYRKIEDILKQGKDDLQDSFQQNNNGFNSKKIDKVDSLIELTKESRIKNLKGHVKAIGNVLTFGKLFEHPLDKQARGKPVLAGGGHNGRTVFVSPIQAIQVVESNPETFSNKKDIDEKGGIVFKNYIKEHGVERHLAENFFGFFNKCTFKRNTANKDFARYNENGELVDQEELLALDYYKNEPLKDISDGQLEGQAELTTLKPDDSLKEEKQETTQEDGISENRDLLENDGIPNNSSNVINSGSEVVIENNSDNVNSFLENYFKQYNSNAEMCNNEQPQNSGNDFANVQDGLEQ